MVKSIGVTIWGLFRTVKSINVTILGRIITRKEGEETTN